MSAAALRDVVEDRWKAMGAAHGPSGATMITSALPIETPEGNLLLGIDRDGRRHLMAPLAPRQTVPTDIAGRAVQLTTRTLEDETRYQAYADLVLLDPLLEDVFTSLCEDVLVAVEREPSRAIRSLRQILQAWRALLADAAGPLGTNALAGLFGELQTLRLLLALDPGAAVFWRGPTGAVHDFRHGPHAIEVKATTTSEGRLVRIHGTDQLDPPTEGTLTLTWFRLAVGTSDGEAVPDLVREVLEMTDDPLLVRRNLAAVGYSESDRRRYADVRFSVTEQRSYHVAEGFPRIVPAGLVGDSRVGGVIDLSYTVDLNSTAAERYRAYDFVDAFLGVA